MEIQQIDCPHCEGSGVCRADNGQSCGTCLKAAKIGKEAKVVRCDVCLGIGKAESKTARLMGRMPFLIVMVVLAIFYMYALSNANNDERFSQIFPLIGSLTTMIVTFYFSKK